MDSTRPFNLLRWFAWLSPVVIAITALANGWQISSFLNNHLFQREAAVSRDFVQNILLSDGSLEYLAQPGDVALAKRFVNTTEHLSNLRDVLRANVFSRDGTVIWSSDRDLIGRRFSDNDELEEAMRGELVVNAGRITADNRQKPEHVGLNPQVEFFVETYIPIVRPGTSQVVGAVELYKAPLALTQAIEEGRLMVAAAALASGLVLYLSLFWLIRRADRTIKQQHTQLLEAQTLAVIGEMATAVAHNIRNPLASIRSAAELAQASPTDDCTEQTRDIMREVDRISQRINELLRLGTTSSASAQSMDLMVLLRQCQADYQPVFERLGQTLHADLAARPIHVQADPVMLRQVFHSLLSNASEAMQPGGQCRILLAPSRPNQVQVDIADTGPGIAQSLVSSVMRPFVTSKPQGLGLGLPLAKQLVERFGGSFSLRSSPEGTTVSVTLPRN